MFERRSLKWPIFLGVTMIVLIIVIIIGWVLLSVFGAMRENENAALYWTLLTVGSTFLGVILVGVVLYLALSIKAINLGRRQSNFIDSVTHELKSPIASLKLCLQTIARRNLADSERESFQRFMLEDVERLDHLINHLLEAGRVQKQTVSNETENVDLADALAACASIVCLRYRMPASTVRLDTVPCEVRAARSDLEMIFRNLIDNAVKYAGDPPQVEVTSRRSGPHAVIVRVADNGCGIPKSQRANLFHRFTRLGLELERDKPGTGLGLYIVRTLVRRLRGSIRVRDRESGIGSVFEVQLPAVPSTAAKTPLADSSASPSAADPSAVVPAAHPPDSPPATPPDSPPVEVVRA